MKIFLIRHGESIQNVGINDDLLLPDNKVYLTDNGKKQANAVGKFLSLYVEENSVDISNARLWVSPYTRTRQTASIINSFLNIKDVKEDYALVEQKYGLFSDKSLDKIKEMFPVEFEYYDNYYKNDSKFYVNFPLGESPFDVALRTRLFLETIFRDKEKGIDTLFIVTHGTVLRCFLMNYFHYSPEWFCMEPTPINCSVRYISEENGKNIDNGYIYGGEKIKKLKL